MSSVDETISNFVQCAERFLGVHEGTAQHSIILALYNSSRPNYEYNMGNYDPWCAAFVGACSGALALQGVIPVTASCARLEQGLKEKGAVITTAPQPGDIVLFDWNGDGKYDDHTGIVVKNENGKITTIEGNHNDAVEHRVFSIGSLPARFYRPAWSGPIQSTTSTVKMYRAYYDKLNWEEKGEIKTLRTVKKGDTGIFVKILQDFLGLEPDGKFGDETYKSLLKYQDENELEVDGVCGKQTWSSFFA